MTSQELAFLSTYYPHLHMESFDIFQQVIPILTTDHHPLILAQLLCTLANVGLHNSYYLLPFNFTPS